MDYYKIILEKKVGTYKHKSRCDCNEDKDDDYDYDCDCIPSYYHSFNKFEDGKKGVPEEWYEYKIEYLDKKGKTDQEIEEFNKNIEAQRKNLENQIDKRTGLYGREQSQKQLNNNRIVDKLCRLHKIERDTIIMVGKKNCYIERFGKIKKL